MRDLILLFVHVVTVLIRLVRPGGMRAVLAESVLLRHQLLILNRSRHRGIIGFGVHRGIVDGIALCRMFKRAVRWQAVPKYLSSDHDPLYRFHQWQANLRVLDVT